MCVLLLVKQGDKVVLFNFYNELLWQVVKLDFVQCLLLGKIVEYLKCYFEVVQWYYSVFGGDELSEVCLCVVNVQVLVGWLLQVLDEVYVIQFDVVVDDDVCCDVYLLEVELCQCGDDSVGELDVLVRGLVVYLDDNGLLYVCVFIWECCDDILCVEVDLCKILVIDLENVLVLNVLGYILVDCIGCLQEVLELIDCVCVVELDNVVIVDSYGWVLYCLGCKDEVLVQLCWVWILVKDLEIVVYVGEVLWVLGKYDEVCYFFDEVVKFDFENCVLLCVCEKFNL